MEGLKENTMHTNAAPPASDSSLLTVREVAAILKVNERTCQRLAARAETGLGDFPKRLRLGPKTVRWRRADVDAYIARLAQDSSPESCRN